MGSKKMDDLYGEVITPGEKIEIPPKRTYVVLRKDPRHPDEIESVTIEAHKAMLIDGQVKTVAFFDYYLHPDGGPAADMHRILFDVVDVEQVMRELSQPGTSLVAN